MKPAAKIVRPQAAEPSPVPAAEETSHPNSIVAQSLTPPAGPGPVRARRRRPTQHRSDALPRANPPLRVRVRIRTLREVVGIQGDRRVPILGGDRGQKVRHG